MASTETETTNTNGAPGGEEQPSSSTTSAEGSSSKSAEAVPAPQKKEESLKMGGNFLVQGKRHLAIKDFQSAMESLGEACRLLTEADSLNSNRRGFDTAEAHFFYGKALLEQSRIELGVVFEGPELGQQDASEDDSDEEENEKSDDDDDEDDEAEVEATKEVLKSDDEAESSEAAANGTSEEKDEATKPSASEESAVTSTDEAGKTTNGQDQEVDLNAPSPIVTSGQVVDNEVPSTSSGLTADALAEKQAEEELSNLELAWEVLEVAKLGYRSLLNENVEKRKSAEIKTEDEQQLAEKDKLLKKRLADIHCSLGEVATESENYNQAIGEFKTGLDILNEIEGSDSREIAQYYFQMGLAYSFDKRFPDAIASFRKSVEIIENRIGILKNKIENKQTKKDLGIENEDEKPEADEVQELTALLPELQEKISDTIDAERESQALEEEEKKEKEIILRNSPVKNPNPPAANDISHLVKKKKKAEDDPANEPPSKKLCTEAAVTPSESTDKSDSVAEASTNGSNAASAANGHPNAIVA